MGKTRKPSTSRRPRIQPQSRDLKQDGLSTLRNCRCFDEVDRKIRIGVATPAVVKMIREEHNECLDISEDYLKQLVNKYRKSIPPTELAVTSPNSVIGRNATRRMAEGLNELEEVERLYRLQMERIDIDFENEKIIKKLFASTGREVFVAMKLLKQSADLKMDLGLAKRQLGTLEVTGQRATEIGERYGSEQLAKVITDPDSRRKVLALAEKLIMMGGHANIDKVVEETIIDVSATEAPTGQSESTEAPEGQS